MFLLSDTFEVHEKKALELFKRTREKNSFRQFQIFLFQVKTYLYKNEIVLDFFTFKFFYSFKTF
jgi:hypothetical protein